MKKGLFAACCLLSVSANATVIDYAKENGFDVNGAGYAEKEAKLIERFGTRSDKFHRDMIGVMFDTVRTKHRNSEADDCYKNQSKPIPDYMHKIPSRYKELADGAKKFWDGSPMEPDSREGKAVREMCEYSIYYKECDEHTPQEILRSIVDYGFYEERDLAWVRLNKCLAESEQAQYGGEYDKMRYLYDYFEERLEPHLEERNEAIERYGLDH